MVTTPPPVTHAVARNAAGDSGWVRSPMASTRLIGTKTARSAVIADAEPG
jgi:hypothetical protein